MKSLLSKKFFQSNLYATCFMQKYLFTALVIQLLVLIIWFLVPNSSFLILGIVAALVIFFLSLFSHEKIILILSLYLSVLPIAAWGKRYAFFGIYISFYVIVGLLALAIIYKLLKNRFENLQRGNFSSLDKMMLLFLFWTIFAGLHGYLRGFSSGYHFTLEILYVFFYGCYFLIDTSDIDMKWITKFNYVLILATVIVSFELIMILMQTFQRGMLARIVTRQPHITLITFPLMISYVILSPSLKNKLFSLIALLPTTLLIIICQQRGLWVGTGFSLLVLLFYLGLSKGISKKILFGAIVSGVFFLLASFFVLIRSTGTQVSTTLGMRIFSLLALEWDLSWAARTGEISIAFKQLGNGLFLIGTGFGSNILRLAAPVYSEYLDNSFAQIIWKMGVIGFGIYLIIIIMFFKRCLYLYHHTADVNVKIISISYFAGYIGLFMVGLTNRVLIGYRFIIFWALGIAIIEILYKKTMKKNRETS